MTKISPTSHQTGYPLPGSKITAEAYVRMHAWRAEQKGGERVPDADDSSIRLARPAGHTESNK